MISLGNCKSLVKPYHLINQILQETYEREKCSSNILVYGVPESFDLLDDNSAFSTIMSKLNLTTPSNLKTMRLGKSNPGSARSLKIFCGNKNSAMKILSNYRSSKEEFTKIFKKFKIVSHKTLLQRQLLRSCHIDLDNCIKNGESILSISYVNGVPRIISIQKTRETTKSRLNHLIHKSLKKFPAQN